MTNFPIDTESLNEEREQTMLNYLQAEAGSDADHSSFRNTTGSCSGADSDEYMGTSQKRSSTGNNSGTISPENRDGSSSGSVDSSSTTSHNSSQLREMLLGSSSGSSSYGRAKSSSSSSTSSRNCNTDDSNSTYKFKSNIHQRFTADLEHVYPPATDSSIRPHPKDQLNTTTSRHQAKSSDKSNFHNHSFNI